MPQCPTPGLPRHLPAALPNVFNGLRLATGTSFVVLAAAAWMLLSR